VPSLLSRKWQLKQSFSSNTKIVWIDTPEGNSVLFFSDKTAGWLSSEVVVVSSELQDLSAFLG
jgi:hypothetical protein